ncbi:MAG: cytochrome c oxidase subunit 3 [Chloroflexota bacterium]
MSTQAGTSDRHEHQDHMGFGEQEEHAARSNMLLGVKLGILSEVMLFGALFAAYFVIRSESGGWPPDGHERPELLLPGINTLLLLSSSVTMQWAVRAIGRGDVQKMRLGLRITLLLGSIFIIVQGYEFATSGFGLDAGVFGSTFYTLTGFHGAHVLAGLGFMAIVATRARRGLISAERHTAVEAASYYWHFVDVVWVFLFSTLYVL